MVLDESETLPLLQGELASRSGRRATRRVLAAATTLVALSALAYSSTVPRAARRGAFSWTCPDCAPCPPGPDCAPLEGTYGDYGQTCKDCSEHGSGLLATWSCDCQMPNGYFRGTSTVWKWTCQGTELVNDDGCLQCADSRVSGFTFGNVCMTTN